MVYNNGVFLAPRTVSFFMCFSKIHFSKLVYDGHLKEKLVKKRRVDPLLFPRGLIKVFLGFPGKPPFSEKETIPPPEV